MVRLVKKHITKREVQKVTGLITFTVGSLFVLNIFEDWVGFVIDRFSLTPIQSALVGIGIIRLAMYFFKID